MTPDATTSEEKSSRSYWGFVLWPVAVVVLYALSYGPVLRAVGRGHLNRDYLAVYRPLVCAVWDTPLQKPLDAYARFWAPNIYYMPGGMVYTW